MRASWNVVAPPAEEPVTLARAKLHLRIDGDAEDALVGDLIAVGREVGERESGHAFVTQTIEMAFSAPDDRLIRLPSPPVQSVASLKYLNADGTETTVDPADYRLVSSPNAATVLLRSGATFSPDRDSPMPWTIRYVAGYGGPSAVPTHLKQGVLLLAGHYYENREATTDITLVEVPFAAKTLFALDRATGVFFD